MKICWLVISCMLFLTGCVTPNPSDYPSIQVQSAKSLKGKSISILVTERTEYYNVKPNVAYYDYSPSSESVVRAYRDTGLFDVVGLDIYKPDLIAATHIIFSERNKPVPELTGNMRTAGSMMIYLSSGLLIDLADRETTIVVKTTILDSYGRDLKAFEKSYVTESSQYDMSKIVYDLVRSTIDEVRFQEIL